MMRQRNPVGHDAVHAKGWWRAHRWWLLRRATQLGVLALFLAGPWFGWWLVKGNLGYSLTLGTLPLTDPLLLAQVLLSGHVPAFNALLGGAIVLVVYSLLGGRVFCAWVCPLNVLTDAAAWVRRRLGLRGGADLPRATRYALLALVLALALGTGSIVWELVNPVSVLHRGLIFGFGAGWLAVAAIFLLDVFVMERGWCGHLCPMGAFYGLLRLPALVKVHASQRQDCNDCLDCFAVCPEPQVIRLPLKGAPKGASPVVASSACTRCGACVDICAQNVFHWNATQRARPAMAAQPPQPHP
ncbi:MAG: quinol dehydrogenase ferredoxin subunit NapH [Rhodoferax sp.]